MDTLLEKMNNKETNNTILLKKKIITLLKNQEVINLFKKAKDFDSAYTISATTDKYNIYLTTDTNRLGYPNKGDFWLKVIDRKKIIPFNNVLLEAYIDTVNMILQENLVDTNLSFIPIINQSEIKSFVSSFASKDDIETSQIKILEESIANTDKNQ